MLDTGGNKINIGSYISLETTTGTATGIVATFGQKLFRLIQDTPNFEGKYYKRAFYIDEEDTPEQRDDVTLHKTPDQMKELYPFIETPEHGLTPDDIDPETAYLVLCHSGYKYPWYDLISGTSILKHRDIYKHPLVYTDTEENRKVMKNIYYGYVYNS